MAKDDKPADLMNYDVPAAGRVAARVIKAADAGGGASRLPGDHHFYISFRTDATGVEAAPTEILERYPEEMTIVLQNQFWDLVAGDETFSVTLQFGGQPKALSIPYRAVTRFYDPSVQYLLQFVVEPVGKPPSRRRRSWSRAR